MIRVRQFSPVLPIVLAAVGAARAADEPAKKPDLKVTAEALMKEVAADPKAASTKYMGKVIAVSGTVSSVDGPYTKNILTLNAGKKKPTDIGGLFVDGKLAEGQLEKARLLGIGQKVEMTGEVTKVEADRVTLGSATVGGADKSSLPTVTAKDLAAAYAKDLTAAGKKYGDLQTPRDVLLTGTVREVKDAGYGRKNVFLDGSGKLSVRLSLPAEEAAGLKKGDTVTAKATCRGPGHTELEGQILCDGNLVKDGGKK